MNIRKCIMGTAAAVCAATLSAIDIEAALQQTAEQFSSSIKNGTTIAIIGISSPTVELSEFMLDEITLGFVQARKLTVANRANLEAIKTEMNFQLSGEVSDDSIQQIGAMVGANVVIHGSMKPLGRNYNLVVQALDVTTAAVIDMCRFSIESNDTTKALLDGTPTPVSKQGGKSQKQGNKAAADSASSQANSNSKSARNSKPPSIPQESGEYKIIDLSEIQESDIRDKFCIYNRSDVPIQVAVYSPGTNNEWVYAGGIMLKARSSGNVSELSNKKIRPPLYGVRIADASGGGMNFLVSWDTGNHDLRVYVQPSFF